MGAKGPGPPTLQEEQEEGQQEGEQEGKEEGPQARSQARPGVRVGVMVGRPPPNLMGGAHASRGSLSLVCDKERSSTASGPPAAPYSAPRWLHIRPPGPQDVLHSAT